MALSITAASASATYTSTASATATEATTAPAGVTSERDACIAYYEGRLAAIGLLLMRKMLSEKAYMEQAESMTIEMTETLATIDAKSAPAAPSATDSTQSG